MDSVTPLLYDTHETAQCICSTFNQRTEWENLHQSSVVTLSCKTCLMLFLSCLSRFEMILGRDSQAFANKHTQWLNTSLSKSL